MPLPAAPKALGAKLVRYGAVSLVATTTSLVVLGLLVSTRTMAPGWANVVATAVGTVPSFELNRRWVWRQRGSASIIGQVVPFAVLSFAGLALSTLTVVVAAALVDGRGIDGATRTLLVQAANLAGFGSLWVLQFVVLDRWLFRSRGRAELVPLCVEAAAGPLEEQAA
jgi:putative flippase GtrA